jgi:hypothetical protein
VGWGHSSVVQSLQPQCNIYVYLEHKAAFTEIFSEELGDELNQFILEDVNHDGKPEIIVTATSGAYQQMYIWQIQSTGNIAEIQRIDGYEVHTLAPRFLGSDTGIFVAHKSQSPAAGNLCFDTEEYLWSRRQKKFVKDSR